MSAPPIRFVWTDDGTFRPLPRFAKLADKHFAVGEEMWLVEHHDRSANSQSHYFAALKQAWRNLPEEEAERFPSSEHLRKWCLIRAGYSNSQTVVCESNVEAMRFIALAKTLDEFCVVTIREKVATVFTAKSQQRRKMDGKEFQDSKSKVLEECARLIGVDAATLSANARVAA